MDNPNTPAFSAAEYRRRLTNVRNGMAKNGLDSLLVIVPENICYLTGYETIGFANFTMLIVPVESEPVLLVREMERTVAETTTWLSNFESFEDTEDPVERSVAVLRDRAYLDGRLGLELGSSPVPVVQIDQLRTLLGTTQDGTGLVESSRAIKSEEELALIRRACRVTEVGMEAALQVIQVGVTENDIAAAAYGAMMKAGSDFFVGDPIVTSGWRSGVAHMTFANRKVEAADTILLELGGCQRRYFGALMRGAALNPVRDEVRRMADTIIVSLNSAIDCIKPGITSGEVDESCRGVLERAGYEPYFRKRTGYSVGIAYAPGWGEGHIISLQKDDPTPLQAGMVFHMPPALRITREYGLGFSETVLVTETGCEVLTNSPRSLHVANGEA